MLEHKDIPVQRVKFLWALSMVASVPFIYCCIFSLHFLTWMFVIVLFCSCPFCKSDKLFRAYEEKLFSFVDKFVSSYALWYSLFCIECTGGYFATLSFSISLWASNKYKLLKQLTFIFCWMLDKPFLTSGNRPVEVCSRWHGYRNSYIDCTYCSAACLFCVLQSKYYYGFHKSWLNHIKVLCWTPVFLWL